MRPAGFGLSLIAFVGVWSLYFIVTEYASAIHNDMAEAYAWGREFQLGYNQHPPFWAWICGLWFSAAPRANGAFAILSMLNAGAGLFGARALLGRFTTDDASSAATALLILTPFYTFLAYKYNANAIFLSLWPWTAYFFVGALRGGGWRDALGLGLLMGLALNSKYYALTLAATCLIAALTAPERARYFRSVSPYLSVALALLLWLPHLLWLTQAGAPPLRYLERVSGRGFGETLLFAIAALAGAAAQQLPALALIVFAARRERGETAVQIEDRRLLTILALAPAALSFAAALALRTKLSSNMLIGVFPLTPLLAMLWLRSAPALLRLWAIRAAAIVSLGALAASPLIALAKARWGRDSEEFEPRREAALTATQFWESVTPAPLAFVAGSFRYDNAAVFYSPQNPGVFVGFDFFGNRWVSAQALAERGLLTICLKDDAPCLAETARFATPQTRREEVTLAHSAYGATRRPFTFEITAIPPR